MYDIAIIGTGVAGAFTILKLATEYPDLKILAIDIGRPPAKRRRQLEGWLGCLPNSDGKLYLTDLDKTSIQIGKKKSKSYLSYVKSVISNVKDLQEAPNSPPKTNLLKKIAKHNYEFELNNYIPTEPKDSHALSKYMVSKIEPNKNVKMLFDEEVIDLSKEKKYFTVKTEYSEHKAKKVLLCAGRAGWRWANSIYSKFGIIQNNDYAKFGIKIETQAENLKDFNHSTCTLKKENLEIGPFCWGGTVIPEDHIDTAITAFRANENRWITDKVSFDLMGKIEFKNTGIQQLDRIARLTFLIANDRIVKEKLSSILTKKSKISIIPEYDWLIQPLKDLYALMPELEEKSYYHVPTITAATSSINIYDNLQTDIPGLFVAGESANITGLLSAMITGSAAADFMVGE